MSTKNIQIKKLRIGNRIHKYYAEKYKLSPQDFPNAQIANDCSISLPLFHGLRAEEQSYVIKKVKDLL